ncbi:MAG TPA: SDR family NAD(P)-dependent oxidoreductase [Gemmatimonadales bacterium]|jgi:NAD(P)-dependent dehydrogenase (short-subunit alcohol dehydrogenase family)|nr:SDR family NAD(P)-dependent oxidoreductase [Gemmatimonadales bacterium]
MSRATDLLAGGALAGWMLMKLMRERESFSFQGKTVLVTGGSRGLGLVLARDSAAAGAKVAICGRDPDALERARAALERIGAVVVAVPADIADPESVRLLVGTVTERLGPVDVLINNAGVIEVGPAETMSVADYEEAMDTNFWGMVYPTLSILPSMRARGGGRIVNITSIGGKLGIPHLLPYSASKFAAMGFSQGLRAEVAQDGIAVTTVIPGLMRTGSPRNAIFRGKHRAEYAWFSIADSLPGLSVSANEASRRILSAVRRGDAEVLFPVVARLAVIGSAVAPNVTAAALHLAARLLPGAPSRRTGRKRGKDSQSGFSPSWLSRRGDEAARKYNQVAPAEGSRA